MREISITVQSFSAWSRINGQRCPFRRFFDGIDSKLEDSHLINPCLALIYSLVKHRWTIPSVSGQDFATTTTQLLQTFFSLGPHPFIIVQFHDCDKKSMADDGMPPGSLSLRSYHLYMKSLPLTLSSTRVFFLHCSRWPSFFKFSAVWPCVLLKLIREEGLLTWTWIKKGPSFDSSFPSWRYAHFNHVQLTASGLIYGIIILSLRLLPLPLLLYSPCPLTPRCLEHDDSKVSKIEKHWACSINCHANSSKEGLRLWSSYRAWSWILYASFSASRRAYHAPCLICLCDDLWYGRWFYKLSPSSCQWINHSKLPIALQLNLSSNDLVSWSKGQRYHHSTATKMVWYTPRINIRS